MERVVNIDVIHEQSQLSKIVPLLFLCVYNYRLFFIYVQTTKHSGRDILQYIMMMIREYKIYENKPYGEEFFQQEIYYY